LLESHFFHQFAEKLAEASRRFAGLKSDLQLAHQMRGDMASKTGLVGILSRTGLAKKDNDLKLAFSEFYLSLILLQNYQNLNCTGFRKILKNTTNCSIETVAPNGVWRKLKRRIFQPTKTSIKLSKKLKTSLQPTWKVGTGAKQ
jgi:hypothetical protein